jgi:hypothetical protein
LEYRVKAVQGGQRRFAITNDGENVDPQYTLVQHMPLGLFRPLYCDDNTTSLVVVPPTRSATTTTTTPPPTTTTAQLRHHHRQPLTVSKS